MKVSLPGRHSLHRSRATGLHDNGILVSEAGPHPCLHGDIDGLCAALTPWAVPASSNSSEPHPLPETSREVGRVSEGPALRERLHKRAIFPWATAGVRCRRPALETPWKRPRATKRKTRQREISLNLLEPASVRDSGDEAKLGATISSHLSRRRSRVRVPSLPSLKGRANSGCEVGVPDTDPVLAIAERLASAPRGRLVDLVIPNPKVRSKKSSSGVT